MKILFITRSFPPREGGLERVAFSLYTYFSKREEVILIKWSGGKKGLFFILPVFLFKAFWILIQKDIDVIYLNEGFMSIIGIFLKIFRKPVVLTVHGLDITFSNFFYQCVIPRCISLLDKVICISRNTQKECINRGIPAHKIVVIPDGFTDEFLIQKDRTYLRESIGKKFSIDLNHKQIILSVCRLVKRKGIHWFVQEVMPLIAKDSPECVYLVAGEGPFRSIVENSIKSQSLEDRVFLLGRIDDDTLKILYNVADIFVMPNIPVEGDIEGFGVVLLEAASCKLPIVASSLEGIKDALLDGAAGVLVPPGNKIEFKDKIVEFLRDSQKREKTGEEARNLVIKHFSWDRIADKYLNVLGELIKR